ncbi:MAG: metal ABC transporter permease [Gammaproteobacteria bacterium]|jgi:zinc transport system permease protein|nr:metal ABC transporter permease [Gammaproteobacteria bacterium]MBP6051784.1 metal ABC transporter permease [Pseudomonadales bacterium]MBK6582991.1 metal ABC transporter permease [Gammaproteobacteria bacterium]MBK7519119.1 metal ABC transporter permease [Gammaproteobacteria bacterium]MBK7730140.1 metal ABC transporter permease [Gammaproteobacteria bacterium]
MDEFLLRALAAGIGVATIAGALGCFLVWRRMAFFGDTLSHSALLGIALGLFLGIDITLAALLLCAMVAVAFARLQRTRLLGSDTLLGVIAHGTLAAGIIAVTVLAPRRANIESYLFGDLLAVGANELQLVYGVGFIAALLGALFWRPWLAIAVDEELAQIEGIAVERLKLLQMLAIAALIAVAMNVVGVLLVTALLVIPPAAARAFARSPEQMAAGGAVLGSLSVVAGLLMSWYADTPAGPSVVVAACTLFALCHGLARAR